MTSVTCLPRETTSTTKLNSLGGFNVVAAQCLVQLGSRLNFTLVLSSVKCSLYNLHLLSLTQAH